MKDKGKSNKIITLILALIIIIAAITLIYVNIADEETDNEEDNDDTNTDDEILLTLIYGDEEKEYTLSMLENNFESNTGYGGIIKTGWFPNIVTEGPFNYTGVKISTILDEFNNLPNDYNITVTSSDGKINEYDQTQINGEVEVYNGSSTENYDIGEVTMILAYQKETEYLDEIEGPLRVVFVDNGIFTSSRLWSKYIISIEIFEN